MLLNRKEASGQQPATTALTADERAAIEHCRQMIRDLQLSNGAFDMRLERDPKNPEDQKQAAENEEKLDETHKSVDSIRVVPYFSTFMALALMSAHAHDKAHPPAPQESGQKTPAYIEDLNRVARYLRFYTRHQDEKTGYITDYKGSRSKGTFESTGNMDSVDSYAAGFLQIADRYVQALDALSPEERKQFDALQQNLHATDRLTSDHLKTGAKLSLKALKSVQDSTENDKNAGDDLAAFIGESKKDNLTFATPTYRVKYLLDNVEVYGGLVAGERLFKTLDLKPETEQAKKMAKEIGDSLPSFWQEEKSCFAAYKDEAGRFHGALTVNYPDGMANTAGLSWLTGNKDALAKLWEKVNKKSPWAAAKPKTDKPADDLEGFFGDPSGKWAYSDANPVERWFMAAQAIGAKDADEWKKRMVEEGKHLPKHLNGQRPAVLLLATLEGAKWMPSLKDELQKAPALPGR